MLTEDNDPKQKHDEMLLGGHRPGQCSLRRTYLNVYNLIYLPAYGTSKVAWVVAGFEAWFFLRRKCSNSKNFDYSFWVKLRDTRVGI